MEDADRESPMCTPPPTQQNKKSIIHAVKLHFISHQCI